MLPGEPSYDHREEKKFCEKPVEGVVERTCIGGILKEAGEEYRGEKGSGVALKCCKIVQGCVKGRMPSYSEGLGVEESLKNGSEKTTDAEKNENEDEKL